MKTKPGIFLPIVFPLIFCISLNAAPKKYILKEAFTHKFDQPLDMAVYPDKINSETFYAVVEKKGKIFLVAGINARQSKLKIPLLDLSKKICSGGYEEGLLGLSFDPGFEKNKRAYIYYSTCSPNSTHISRLVLSSKPKNGIPEFSLKEEVLLSIPQPYRNHNGGCIKFGTDGLLYIGTGDGGSAGDPENNAQNTNSLLGKILRIDVSPAKGFRNPPDNPFPERPEVYAYGLRNPWRFSIDLPTGKIIAGDVGQDQYEEITYIHKGQNHGWNIMEGLHCYSPRANCNKKNIVMPVYEYDHSEGQSVIGGFIYRGSMIKSLYGKYIFGDYMSGKIWGIILDQPQPTAVEIIDTGFFISSFGIDENNEIYVLSINRGKVYLITD
jgi:glucose/arabinose dehydrogenase